MMKFKLKSTHFFLILFLWVSLFGFLSSCSSLDKDRQYTNKVVAPNFVSELYGTSTQTISVAHPEGGHISWMGFLQSNDYKYFQIVKVQVGSQTVVEDGKEINGETFSASSNAVVENVEVGKTEKTDTGFVNGNVSVSGSSDLKITIRYSPLIAIKAEKKPHDAYLIINYDKPKVGSLRIRLAGFTQGVKADKCTQAVSTMDVIEYNIVNSNFDLYFCGAEVGKVGQNNTPQDPSDPNFHGTSTNLASIPVTDPVVTFYQVDDETVCVLTSPKPTVEPFMLPIPDGLAPIDEMAIEITKGSFAECQIDVNKNIICPENIQITALVPVSGLSLRNSGFSAEELATADCPDFGAINGAGKFGDDAMTILLTGRTLKDKQTETYNIVDSLIMAVIKLEK